MGACAKVRSDCSLGFSKVGGLVVSRDRARTPCGAGARSLSLSRSALGGDRSGRASASVDFVCAPHTRAASASNSPELNHTINHTQQYLSYPASSHTSISACARATSSATHPKASSRCRRCSTSRAHARAEPPRGRKSDSSESRAPPPHALCCLRSSWGRVPQCRRRQRQRQRWRPQHHQQRRRRRRRSAASARASARLWACWRCRRSSSPASTSTSGGSGR